MKINNFNKFLIIFFLLLFSLMPIVYSLDNLETGHYIQQNTPTNVNYANGLCSRITSPSKLFIPNKTVEEFQSFLNKASALGVSFSGCCDEACLDPFDYNVARCGDSLLTGCGDENNCGISLACPVSTEECNGADCCNANCDDYPASEVSCGKPILNGCYSACGGVGTKNDCGNDQYCGISGDCVACPVCSSPSQVNCGTPFYTPYISGCTTKSCGYGINSMQCSSGYCAEDGSHCCSVCPDSGSYNCGTPIPSNNCDQSCGYGTDASSCPVEQFCDTSSTIPECKPIPTPDCDEGFPFASEVSCGVPIKNDCGFDTDPPTCGLKDDCGSGQYCNGCNGCKTCTVKLPSEINCGDSYTNECGDVVYGSKDTCTGDSICKLLGTYKCCNPICADYPASDVGCGSVNYNDCGSSCGYGIQCPYGTSCTSESSSGKCCPDMTKVPCDETRPNCGYGSKCDTGYLCNSGTHKCELNCESYSPNCDPSDYYCYEVVEDQCGLICISNGDYIYGTQPCPGGLPCKNHECCPPSNTVSCGDYVKTPSGQYCGYRGTKEDCPTREYCDGTHCDSCEELCPDPSTVLCGNTFYAEGESCSSFNCGKGTAPRCVSGSKHCGEYTDRCGNVCQGTMNCDEGYTCWNDQCVPYTLN